MIIRGAGVFGLACAWSLTRRGARVAVVDPNGIAAGASGGPVGALAPHTPENWNDKKAFQFESLLLARTYWPEVEAASGLPTGYGPLGRLQPIADERAKDLAQKREVGAKELWQGQANWRVLKAADLPTDWLKPPSPTGFYVHDTLTARIAPTLACHALAGAVTARGSQVVAEWTGNHAPILDASGTAGLAALSKELDRTVGNGVKGQAAVLGYNAGDAPQVFADALHIVPHAGGTVAIGSTSERDFDSPSDTDAQLDHLIEKAIGLCPALARAPVLSRWAGVRPRTRSRAPMLGPWPGKQDVFIANGGFKIGFGVAPLVGEVMADLILDGRNRIPDPFRVEASL